MKIDANYKIRSKLNWRRKRPNAKPDILVMQNMKLEMECHLYKKERAWAWEYLVLKPHGKKTILKSSIILNKKLQRMILSLYSKKINFIVIEV